MNLILTHENADFDAIAAQWAAHRLWPEGVPLLPRRVNRNVSHFLLLYGKAFRFERPETWRRQRVDRVILVDTHNLPSARGVRRDTPVQVIDHHTGLPRKPEWEYRVEGTGAATTLLVEEIQAAGLTLSADEATLFLLGIYEDTGSLSYDTTTPRDARAAAWLLEQSADLTLVRRFLELPLSPAQQALYDQLATATEWHTVEGQAIVVVAVTGPTDFEDEISTVVTRLRDALQPVALFALVALPHRVHLVARSSADAVDADHVARALGGGGHSRAAAATLHDLPLAEVRHRLLAILPQAVQPLMRVAGLMSRHVRTIHADTPIADAAAEMQRHGHEGYPVVEDGERLVGLLTRQAVDRAVAHGMGHATVRRIMQAGRISVHPSDSVSTVQRLMIEEGWGQIPVLSEASGHPLIGIVTRTDLLRALLHKPRPESAENIPARLQRTLGRTTWHTLRQVGDLAATMQMPIYLVGGPVRDLLLEKGVTDLDVVVEGNAIDLVQTVVARLGGKLHTHDRFGTAKWLPDPPSLAPQADDPPLPNHLDFVSARTEFYTEPTALPTVSRGSIKRDLIRRDFTINTLAVRLDGAHAGELIDDYGGVRDLESGLIRVLHSLSFVDDPTRILRAVRFEQRLGFVIEPRTLALLRESAELVRRVTGPRIRHELELILAEPEAAAMLARLADLGVFAHLHPELIWTRAMAAAFGNLAELSADSLWHPLLATTNPTLTRFLLWMATHSPAVQEAVTRHLHTRADTRANILLLHRLLHRLATISAESSPATLAAAIRPAATQPAVLAAARAWLHNTPAATWLDTWQQSWQHVRTRTTGHELRTRGLTPGPRYAPLLDALLAARLNGTAQTDAEEEALLEQLLSDG